MGPLRTLWTIRRHAALYWHNQLLSRSWLQSMCIYSTNWLDKQHSMNNTLC